MLNFVNLSEVAIGNNYLVKALIYYKLLHACQGYTE